MFDILFVQMEHVRACRPDLRKYLLKEVMYETIHYAHKSTYRVSGKKYNIITVLVGIENSI
jgi:hypothetical protein